MPEQDLLWISVEPILCSYYAFEIQRNNDFAWFTGAVQKEFDVIELKVSGRLVVFELNLRYQVFGLDVLVTKAEVENVIWA